MDALRLVCCLYHVLSKSGGIELERGVHTGLMVRMLWSTRTCPSFWRFAKSVSPPSFMMASCARKLRILRRYCDTADLLSSFRLRGAWQV